LVIPVTETGNMARPFRVPWRSAFLSVALWGLDAEECGAEFYEEIPKLKR
jgi:hypothetical protein